MSVLANSTDVNCLDTYLDDEFGQQRRFYIIILYGLLFVLGASTNILVIISLLRLHHNTRVKLLMVNLCIADIVVVFVIMPIEILRRTPTWQLLNGAIGCKIVQTLRVFGPYLSSMVLICISLDRYFAITKSVRLQHNRFRFKTFLIAAWLISIAFSIPQSIVTTLDQVESCTQVYRCDSIRYFSSPWSSISYRLIKLLVLYFLPLTVISYCYYYICSHVIHNSKELRRYSYEGVSSISTISSFRSSDKSLRSVCSQQPGSISHNQRTLGRIQHTTRQMIKMTMIIIFAFVFCWTPYTILDLLSIFNSQYYEENLSEYVKDIVLLLALANSAINPIIYGSKINLFKSAIRRYRRRP